MKHVNLSSAWNFSTDPFPAYRAKLVFGANKHDEKFLAVTGVSPTNAAQGGGTDTLPEGQFLLTKMKGENEFIVVPGSDTTNRCLLFVGCNGGFRGGVGVVSDATTGTLIKECSAGNACQSSCEVIVLLEVGQVIAFHKQGRSVDKVYTYTWTGTEVEMKCFSIEEWRMRELVASPPADVEVL